MPKILTPDQYGLEIKRVGAGKLISIDSGDATQVRRFRTGYVPPSDPFWSSVQFLQGFNSLTDGAAVDATLPNAKAGGSVNFTCTAARWEISSAQSAGGGKSALATAGVSQGQISGAQVGGTAGVFTFESSVYISSAYDVLNQNICLVSTAGGNCGFVSPSGGANWRYLVLGSVVDFAPFIKDAWNHFAFTRDAANLLRLFFNGSLVVSFTDSTSVSSFRSAFYSRTGGATANTFFNDEIRVTVGVCRYTDNYTPSFPFPTQ